MTEHDENFLQQVIDRDALEAYLETELGPADHYEIDRLEGGSSNETLFVTWGDRDLVLRCPPPGETADSAHDILREYTVMDALQDTTVPVPGTVRSCTDHEVLGYDFYLMEQVDGVVCRIDGPDEFDTPKQRETIGEELISTLAEIHSVDIERSGLEDFGYPDGYTERQIDRWADQYDWASEVTSDVRSIPEIPELTDWLKDNAPDEYPHTLVHGDYKIDNVIFSPGSSPELVSVVDWELSTLGDPFTDLGWLLIYWPTSSDKKDDVFWQPYGYLKQPGYPSRREIVDRYEQLTGYDFPDHRFYRVLALYKLGGIGELLFRRHLEGNSDDELHAKGEKRAPRMASRALEIAKGEEPL